MDTFSKTLGSLWQYHKDYPNDNIRDSESSNFKVIIGGRTAAKQY